MASAGSEPVRILAREDIISQALAKLSTVSAQVTRDEVAEIVDGLGNNSGQYDQQALERVIAESLQLWSRKDQLGFLCTLRLNQENIMDVQRNAMEKMDILSSNIKAEIEEKLAQKMAELRSELMTMFEVQQEGLSLQGGHPEKQDKPEEEQHKEIDAVMKRLEKKLEKKMSELESKLTKMIEESESLRLGGGVAQPQQAQEAHGSGDGIKTLQQEGAKNTPAQEETEEEKRKKAEKQKEDEVWGHLASYDEAFKELQQDPGRNGLAKFKDLSESIVKKHDIVATVRDLLPPLYFNPLERIGSSIKVNSQPFCSTLEELMKFHEDKKPAFDEKVMYVATKTKGTAVIPKMKGRERCSAKALFKYTDETGTSWHRCTDIVRATILYDDIASMYAGVELLDRLHEAGEIEIVEFNDRYQTPMPGNYRDLQLAVKIQGMVAELQLNTKAMAYVKENAGHRSSEVSRELIAAVKESDAPRCDAILLWGIEQVGEKSVEDILNEKKKPVLHEAARQGNADLMKVFIRYKADVNLQTADGQTAMHKAAAGGHERAAWLLICEGAKFLPDNKGKTPLIEGMLNLRVNPSDERIARCVSMIAQMCGPQEFENLLERLEVFVRERLHQSSDLVTACKDSNFEKADRLLREWADPDSRDMSGDLLPAVHVALHGGQKEFAEDRLPVLCRLLEFRASIDAVAKTSGGEQTPLEVALKSRTAEAHLSAVVLIQHGARFKGEVVRENLSPWTSKQIQRAERRELAKHFLTKSLFTCTHELVSVERALWVKGSPLHVLLLRGYEVAKGVEVDEAKRSQVAYSVAHLLGCHGHDLERAAFLSAECSAMEEEDTCVYVVCGASGAGSACNGEYCEVKEQSGKTLYKQVGGDAIIHFDDHDKRWNISLHEDAGSCYCVGPDVPAAAPPRGEWSTEGCAGGDADPAPVVSSYKEQELLDSAQHLQYWVNLVAAAQSEIDTYHLVHAGVSCEALQDCQAPAGAEKIQLAAHLAAKRLRAQQCGKAADDLLQRFNVEEDFAESKTLEDATGAVYCVSFSGDLLAAGSEDHKVYIYKDLVLVKALSDATNEINAVAWSPGTPQLLAAGGDDFRVRVYDAKKEFTFVRCLEDATGFIRSLAWSERYLAAGSDDAKLRLYAVEDFTVVKVLDEASNWIRSICWADEFLAAGSDDRKVRIYDATKEFRLLKSVAEATDWIQCVASSAQGLAAGGDDGQVRVYRPSEDFVLLATLSEASGRIYAVAWLQDLLATGSGDKQVRIYDPAQDYLLVKMLEMSDSIESISSFGSQFAIACGHSIHLHDSAIKYHAFDMEQLWNFAALPEQDDERSPRSPSSPSKKAA